MTSLMHQIIAWFGWGHGIGALAGISAILTIAVILAPVIAGLLFFGLERLQVALLKEINYNFAYFFVNFLTFPGTFIHEMAHLCLGVITGAEIHEICMFENDGGRLGHISYSVRGPWLMQAIQHSLTAVAPTIVGFTLGFFLLRIIFAGGLSTWAYIGLWYLVISLVDHSTMSDADLKHYFQGVWIFIAPLFIFFFAIGKFA